jgi:hypothetical protein
MPGVKSFHLRAFYKQHQIMKTIILFVSLIVAFTPACKTKQKMQTAAADTEMASATALGSVWGIVSHEFKAEGCPSVLVVNTFGQEEPMVLIPKDALPAAFDKEGTAVRFDYRLLRMPNPEGCGVGNIAEITNISQQ